MRLRVAALLACAGLSACASAPALRVDPTAGLDRSFFVRQRVLAHFADETRRFETALESRCGELRLVGLTPFGVRLFSAVRRGSRIEVDTLTGGPLPFPPEHVLRDVERTFFRSPAPLTATLERDVQRGGETVHETWDAGHLVQREIRPTDDPDAAPLVIRYSGATPVDGVPERVDLENPAFGYVLAIDNFDAKEIRCTPASSSRAGPAPLSRSRS